MDAVGDGAGVDGGRSGLVTAGMLIGKVLNVACIVVCLVKEGRGACPLPMTLEVSAAKPAVNGSPSSAGTEARWGKVGDGPVDSGLSIGETLVE